MNSLIDIIILVLLGLGFLLGIKDGLIKIILSISAIVLSIFISISFSDKIGNIVFSLLGVPKTFSSIVGFILIFIIMIILTGILSKIFKPKDGVTSLINRLIGGILGLFQIALFLSIILILLNILHFPSDKNKEESTLYYPTYQVVPVTFSFIKIIFPSSKSFFDSISIIKLDDSSDKNGK